MSALEKDTGTRDNFRASVRGRRNRKLGRRGGSGRGRLRVLREGLLEVVTPEPKLE